MKSLLFTLAALTLSTSAMAAGTHDCTGLDSIGNLIGNTKSFDHVKVAYVSTEEPAVAPDHVLVFVYDNELGSTCTAISKDDVGNGFGYVDMKTLKSVAYDSKKGRLLSIQVEVPKPDYDGTIKQTLLFRVNAATGKVTLE